MKLYEFLELAIPASKLATVLSKNEGINIEYTQDVEDGSHVVTFNIDRDTLLDELESHNIKMTEFDKILQKYGWYISHIRGNNVNLLKLNTIDHGYYDIDDSFYKGIYLHLTKAVPTKILKTGLKAKDSLDPEMDISGTVKRGIIYPDKRVYLWKMEDVSGNLKSTDKNFDKRVIGAFRTLFNGLGVSGYGQYIYMVRLPKGLKTHIDNEYGADCPARYITQDVPPSYIKYIGTVNRIQEIIDTNNVKRLLQILNIEK
jgi:hypothetical protein